MFKGDGLLLAAQRCEQWIWESEKLMAKRQVRVHVEAVWGLRDM